VDNPARELICQLTRDVIQHLATMDDQHLATAKASGHEQRDQPEADLLEVRRGRRRPRWLMMSAAATSASTPADPPHRLRTKPGSMRAGQLSRRLTAAAIVADTAPSRVVRSEACRSGWPAPEPVRNARE
jgi:hypothetical protein